MIDLVEEGEEINDVLEWKLWEWSGNQEDERKSGASK